MKSVALAIVLTLEIVSARVNKMAAVPRNPDGDLTTVSRGARMQCNFKMCVLGIICQFNFITQADSNTHLIQGVPTFCGR
jgi:hypothetical protein